MRRVSNRVAGSSVLLCKDGGFLRRLTWLDKGLLWELKLRREACKEWKMGRDNREGVQRHSLVT